MHRQKNYPPPLKKMKGHIFTLIRKAKEREVESYIR